MQRKSHRFGLFRDLDFYCHVSTIFARLVIQSSIRSFRQSVGLCSALTQGSECRRGKIEITGRGTSTGTRFDNRQETGKGSATALALDKVSAGLIARLENPSQDNDVRE